MISRAEIEWYNEIINELEIVFDVGCRSDNIFYELNSNLELHLFDPKAPAKKMHGTFNQLALSNKIGEAKYHPEYSSMHRRELTGEKWQHLTHEQVTIATTTLDQYCEDHGITKIDLLKIDTEGHDRYVLEGAQRMLPNIRYIQFEHWDEDSTFEIREFLKDYEVDILGGKPVNLKAVRYA